MKIHSHPPAQFISQQPRIARKPHQHHDKSQSGTQPSQPPKQRERSESVLLVDYFETMPRRHKPRLSLQTNNSPTPSVSNGTRPLTYQNKQAITAYRTIEKDAMKNTLDGQELLNRIESSV